MSPRLFRGQIIKQVAEPSASTALSLFEGFSVPLPPNNAVTDKQYGQIDDGGVPSPIKDRDVNAHQILFPSASGPAPTTAPAIIDHSDQRNIIAAEVLVPAVLAITVLFCTWHRFKDNIRSLCGPRRGRGS